MSLLAKVQLTFLRSHIGINTGKRFIKCFLCVFSPFRKLLLGLGVPCYKCSGFLFAEQPWYNGLLVQHGSFIFLLNITCLSVSIEELVHLYSNSLISRDSGGQFLHCFLSFLSTFSYRSGFLQFIQHLCLVPSPAPSLSLNVLWTSRDPLPLPPSSCLLYLTAQSCEPSCHQTLLSYLSNTLVCVCVGMPRLWCQEENMVVSYFLPPCGPQGSTQFSSLGGKCFYRLSISPVWEESEDTDIFILMAFSIPDQNF